MKSGGTIFDLTFKLTFGKFIWALFIVFVIIILLSVVIGIISTIIISVLPKDNLPLIGISIGIIALVSLISSLYFPYDYIYTLGYDDGKKSKF
jgi:hypothetical protein